MCTFAASCCCRPLPVYDDDIDDCVVRISGHVDYDNVGIYHMYYDATDLHGARTVLDEDHDGLDKVKDRILEHLAVTQLNP